MDLTGVGSLVSGIGDIVGGVTGVLGKSIDQKTAEEQASLGYQNNITASAIASSNQNQQRTSLIIGIVFLIFVITIVTIIIFTLRRK